MLTEALRLSGEVSAVKVPQPSRLTLISEGLRGRVGRVGGTGGGGCGLGEQPCRREGSKRAAQEGERPHPTKNKKCLMIDTDSSGLIRPGGDLRLAGRCQPRRCSEPRRSGP